MLSLVLVYFVDGNSGMDNRGLNGLLLHDRLDVLVNVVVDMLSCYTRIGCCGVLCRADFSSIFELCLLSRQTILYVLIIAVLNVAVLNACHLVAVLLGENLTILDGLNGGVVVVLMDLTVNSRRHIFLSSWRDLLVLDCWIYGLQN